jgi:predicted dienelactone hydrolase
MQPRLVAVGLVAVLALVVAACDDSSAPSSQAAASSASPTTTTTAGRRRLIAPDGLRGLLRRERAKSRREEATTTSSTSTTTTTLPSAPFPVAHTSYTFVDHSRPSPARGGAPAQSSRTLVTTVYYPTSVAPTAEAPTPPAAAGRFPLVVFAHGYEIDAAAYAPLLRDLAVGGYVVAAPDFPGTSTAHPGGANRADTLEQPADLSFVITSMLQTASAPGPLQNAIDPDAIGDSGHSDGGVTALATAYNTCCIDPRIKAATILTGGAFGFSGEWFPPGTPPVMFVHATADEINPYSASTSMFAQAQSPKYLLTVEGGSHLEVFVDPPWEPQIAQAMIAFYDLHLKHDASAEARLHTVGNQPGLLSLQTG